MPCSKGCFSAELIFLRVAITRWPGVNFDGIVLSASSSLIRVAVRDCGDAVEFSFHSGRWFSEDGEPVEIELASFDAAEFAEGTQAGAWVN